MLVALLIAGSIALVVHALAGTGTKTRRVSVSSAGVQANGFSTQPAISADGRLVAFTSAATNLVGADMNGQEDVFVRDRKTHRTRIVSVSSAGARGDSYSTNPSISADGHFVAFASNASTLVGNDTNGQEDIFVRNLSTHKTRRVNMSSTGAEADGNSFNPAISADGRFVTFVSDSDNLVGNDTNGVEDIFVRDLKTHKTRRVSLSSSGVQANDFSADPAISADGHLVAFTSRATNLVGGDTNSQDDVFVRNLRTHKTRRVSVSSSGTEGNSDSSEPSISPSGRVVGFASNASNLVGGDTNSHQDVFLRNLKTHGTRLVSVSSSGAQGNGNSFFVDPPTISADERFVTFISQATNLVAGGTSSFENVFLRDLKRHKTKQLNRGFTGAQPDGNSFVTTISADGRFVAFHSNADNLVPSDTNGTGDIFVRGPLR